MTDVTWMLPVVVPVLLLWFITGAAAAAWWEKQWKRLPKPPQYSTAEWVLNIVAVVNQIMMSVLCPLSWITLIPISLVLTHVANNTTRSS